MSPLRCVALNIVPLRCQLPDVTLPDPTLLVPVPICWFFTLLLLVGAVHYPLPLLLVGAIVTLVIICRLCQFVTCRSLPGVMLLIASWCRWLLRFVRYDLLLFYIVDLRSLQVTLLHYTVPFPLPLRWLLVIYLLFYFARFCCSSSVDYLLVPLFTLP